MGKSPQRLPARFDRDDIKWLVRAWRKECGSRVSQRRTLLNLHRRELADLAGTSEPTIIRIEAGEMNPRDELRLMIAGVLRCEVADLWQYPTCERIHDAAQVPTR